MTRWFCSVALVGLCAAPGAAFATQPSSALAAETENADAEAGSDGRTIVVSATRTPITIDDAPVTIS